MDLSGRILISLDMPDYRLLARLRSFLSHDQKILRYKITDKTKNAGNRTRKIELVGFASIVFCSASLDANEKERTRMILLSPSGDQNKLTESLALAALKHSLPDDYR